MSLLFQKRKLSRFIKRMFDEGIVNTDFCHLQEMKQVAKPDFVVRAITIYCLAAQNIFCSLSIQIEQPEVNFCQVEACARDFFDRSSRIGAERVRIACADIVQASQACDKDHCLRALTWTKNEFSRLRRDFESLVQGITNDQFSRALNNADSLECAMQLIDAYCVDVEAILSELRSCIDLPDVDFSKLGAQARNIEEKSMRIGAEHVRFACADLIRACEQQHKENFSQALDCLRNDFLNTRKRLEYFVQLERRVIRLETDQQNKVSSSSSSPNSSGIRNGSS